MKLKQALIGTMAVAVLATVVSVAPASAAKHRKHHGDGDCDERVIVVSPAPAPVIYEDDVTVPGEFAVVRPFHGRRLVNVWNGQRWVTRVIYY